jgi:hypothetical protein
MDETAHLRQENRDLQGLSHERETHLKSAEDGVKKLTYASISRSLFTYSRSLLICSRSLLAATTDSYLAYLTYARCSRSRLIDNRSLLISNGSLLTSDSDS